jgi:hypothetical protein
METGVNTELQSNLKMFHYKIREAGISGLSNSKNTDILLMFIIYGVDNLSVRLNESISFPCASASPNTLL